MNTIKHLSLPLVLFVMTATAYPQMGGGMGPGGEHGHNFDDFTGWQNHQVEHNVVLPQVAVGERVSMTLIFTNLGGLGRMGWLEDAEDSTLTGTLRFFASDGEPLPVRINDVAATQFPLELGPSAVSYLEVFAPAGVELTRGWALIEFDDDDSGSWGFMDGHAIARGERAMVSAYYSIFNAAGELESQVAVRPAIFRQGFFARSIVPAQFRQSAGDLVRTGVAIVNAGDAEAEVGLKLVDQNGEEVGQVSLALPAGGQEARFVDELFASVPDGFQGVLELSTEADGIVSMGLLQTGLVTTSLPTHHYGSWTQSQ